MLNLKRTVIAVCLTLVLPLAAYADTTFSGRAVRVLDGDTIDVLTGTNDRVRVRLANIDAPEKAQAFGQKSKENLTRLVGGQNVKVIDVGGDQYGRRIGRVMVGADEANVEQVRAGLAWVYQRYNHDPRLPSLEENARRNRTGLWLDSSPQEPWTFRRAR
ncbi:thermonuclease family protein [Pseudomonas sp. W22_MBD1_FP4]|uniref:thermonuclease family protein n=1 Tax=Pseudomonas sp. W22_MBD1_FP4 TaxID=3240272 RepID=UPI003F9C788E